MRRKPIKKPVAVVDAMLDRAALGAVEASNCSAHAVVSAAKASPAYLLLASHLQISVDAAVSVSLPRNLELRQAALYT